MMTEYRGLNEGGFVLCKGLFMNEQGAITNLTQDRPVVKIEKVAPDLIKVDTIWTKEEGLLGKALPTPSAKESWAAVETGEYRSFAADGCMLQADHLSRFVDHVEALGNISKNPAVDSIEIVHVIDHRAYPTLLWTRSKGMVNATSTARPSEHSPQPDANPAKPDPWAGRKKGMRCERCMWYAPKANKANKAVGRCRRHPPWAGWRRLSHRVRNGLVRRLPVR